MNEVIWVQDGQNIRSFIPHPRLRTSLTRTLGLRKKKGGRIVSLKEHNKESVKLRSRNNELVNITEARDRVFLEQADALVIKVNERLHNKRMRDARKRNIPTRIKPPHPSDG